MRLIDADALVKILESIRIAYQLDGAVLRENAVKTMIDIIANPAIAPTIEAEPVRHGKWIDKGLEGDFSWKLDGRGSCLRVLACSVCGNNLCGRPGSDFCPHCGAKMDLK